MKALSVWQPYAHFIATGEKPVENRTWATKHRGWFAVHASKHRDSLETYTDDMVFGAVIALAYLDTCVPLADISAAGPHSWVLDHPHTFGPICWLLPEVIRLPEPIECRGYPSLFWLPKDIAAQLCALL